MGIEQAVEATRRRLARAAARRHLVRWSPSLVLAAAALGAARPLLWPLGDDTPLGAGALQALGLMLAALTAGILVLAITGRRKPDALSAARAIDEALGLAEVVASGHAFARAGRTGAVVALARTRGDEAARGLDLERSFPLPSLRPGRRAVGRLLACALAATAVGAYDPVLASVLVAPPTPLESRASAALEEDARALEAAGGAGQTPEHRSKPDQAGGRRSGWQAPDTLARMAEAAARAARRGDRSGALGRLDALRTAAEEGARRSAELEQALHRIARALTAAGARAPGGPGATSRATPGSASDDLRLLARRLRSSAPGDAASAERMLERLSRAAQDAAGASAADHPPDARAAEALQRAAEALSRSDRAAVGRALEEAIQRTQELEAQRAATAAQAAAIVRMLEASGELERAIQLAMMGRSSDSSSDPSLERDGAATPGTEAGSGSEGDAFRRALAARLAALGLADPDSAPSPGPGGHVPDRSNARHDRLEPSGGLRVRSQVREGGRAVMAIRGLGRGAEPTAAFREVFPSYDAQAEEGMADEAIPAARRLVVKRYFQAIRPGQHPVEPDVSPDDERGEGR